MLPMECSMWSCPKSDADDDLLANVQSLQIQLRRTEKNLQTVEKELSSTSGHYSHCFDEVIDVPLEDFVQPKYNCQSFCSCKKNSGRTFRQDFQRKSKSYSTLDKTVEEDEDLQEKLGALHEQNASLTSQNQYLKNRVETMNFELMQSKKKISYLEATVATHLFSIPKLKEQIVNLEAEVSAQDKILK